MVKKKLKSRNKKVKKTIHNLFSHDRKELICMCVAFVLSVVNGLGFVKPFRNLFLVHIWEYKKYEPSKNWPYQFYLSF